MAQLQWQQSSKGIMKRVFPKAALQRPDSSKCEHDSWNWQALMSATLLFPLFYWGAHEEFEDLEKFANRQILVTEGHAPLDNCNKKFYYKMRLGYFSSTVPLQSHSRVHLDNYCFFHSRFTAIFATLGFVAWIAVLSAACHSTPPDFALSAARALPDILKSVATLIPTH